MTIDKIISKTFYKQFCDKYNINEDILKKKIIHEYLCNIYLNEDEETVYHLINFKNLLKYKIRNICDENNKYYISLCSNDHQINLYDKLLTSNFENNINFGIRTKNDIKNNKYNINDIESFSVMLTLYLEKGFLKFKNNTEKYYEIYEDYLETIFEENVFVTNNDNRKPANIINTYVNFEKNSKKKEDEDDGDDDSEYESYYIYDEEESYVMVAIDLYYAFDENSILWKELQKILNMNNNQLKRKSNFENNNIIKKNINFLKETFIENIIKIIDDYDNLFEIYT